MRRSTRSPLIHLPAVGLPSLPFDGTFWTGFLALNCLLFLPLYLFHLEETAFWPWPSGPTTLAGLFSDLTLWRTNFDLFRLNVEFVLLTVLWAHVRWVRRSSVLWLFVLFYFLLLLYSVYEAFTLAIYQDEPVFYNHFAMYRDGFIFLLRHANVSVAAMGGGAALLLASGVAIILTLRMLLNRLSRQRLSRVSKLVLLLLAVAVIAPLLRYQVVLANPQMVVSSFGYKLRRNVTESLKSYQTAQAFDDATIQAVNDFDGHQLERRPNIYIIFVESYGSVLYKRPDYHLAYRLLAGRLSKRLEEGGWHVASTLSEAPTWGGGSWMGYTSALFGLRIDAHPQYLALFDKYATRTYPDLSHYLQGQGYQSVRISALSKELNDAVWEKYRRFYNVDEWLRYGDLRYTGKRYGWGPAPPDQYVLEYARQRMTENSDDPFMLFYITQNSHYPWMPLPEIAEDWQMLNTPAPDEVAPDDESIEHTVRRRNYWNAIDYQLRVLVDYILSGEDDALFVLVGDHQPPRVSRRADGWDTPIHIVSKNAALIAALDEYGFVSGLAVSDVEPTMRHEGFLTLFLRALLTGYGVEPENLPSYFPDGIQFETAVPTGDDE